MSWFRYYTRRIFGPYLVKYSPEQLEKWLSASRTLYLFSTVTLFGVILNARKRAIDLQEKEALLMGLPFEGDKLFSFFHKYEQKPDTVYEYDKEKGWIVKDYQEESSGIRLARETYIKAYKYQREELEAGRSLPPGALILVDEEDIRRKPSSGVKKTVEDVKTPSSEPHKVIPDA